MGRGEETGEEEGAAREGGGVRERGRGRGGRQGGGVRAGRSGGAERCAKRGRGREGRKGGCGAGEEGRSVRAASCGIKKGAVTRHGPVCPAKSRSFKSPKV